jgi:ribonucleoside-diphosphate reductase alpha subunit
MTIINQVVSHVKTVYSTMKLSVKIDFIIEHLEKRLPDNNYNVSELLLYIATYVSNFVTEHYEYDILATELLMIRLNLITHNTYKEVVSELYDKHMVSPKYYEYVMKNIEKIEELRKTKIMQFNYFGLLTLTQSYLLKQRVTKEKIDGVGRSEGKLIERPVDLYIRVAIFVNFGKEWEAIAHTFHLLSNGYYTHATPTMYNAGTNHSQTASCFLFGVDDSLDALLKSVHKLGMVSKWSGGLGLCLSNVRCKGSIITATNGTSLGLIPFIILLNSLARYVNQGGNRKGAIAIYLEPWHGDIMDFLQLRLPTGHPDERALDIFTALWIPDYFMECVVNDAEWYLMCPNVSKGLDDVYGDDFKKLYLRYIDEGKYVTKLKARDVWNAMMTSQIETGTPYIGYKDAGNKKSNQQNLGTIRCSNLCIEVFQYSSKSKYTEDANNISTVVNQSEFPKVTQVNHSLETDEVAVCNLASIALPMFAEGTTAKDFNFQKLYEVVRVVARNTDALIDDNFYPIPETERSNIRHRPIGIGRQGLTDVFMKYGIPYESRKAIELTTLISETIYFAAISESCKLAKKHGAYSSFNSSPASQGKLQFHLWGLNENNLSGMWDWTSLLKNIKQYGLRNSLSIALMPTATTSQILGNTEADERPSTLIYTRKTLAGEFLVINKHLMKILLELGLWNTEMKEKIIYYGGSIQNISAIPDDIKNVFKTVWETSPKAVIDLAAASGPFVCQSQSMNLYLAKPDFNKLTWMHIYGWKKGLKTGMYYLRSRPATNAIQFNLDPVKIKNMDENMDENKEITQEAKMCKRVKKGESTIGCDICSS